VENYVNVEMSKINEWSRRNVIKFRDTNSKAMLVTRKQRERKRHHNILVFQMFRKSYTEEIFRKTFEPEM